MKRSVVRMIGRLGSALAMLAALMFSSALHAQDDGKADAPGDVTGVSRAFNPAISINGLFLGNAMLGGEEEHHHDDGNGHEENGHHDEENGHSEAENGHGGDAHAHGAAIEDGWGVQEIEAQFTSFVDPHVKANVMLGMHGSAGFELEEAYVLTLGMPADLALKAGKYFASFGRHNQLHKHQYPFIEAPLVNESLFGEESLNEVGAELSWLAPVDWYAELIGGVYNGDNPVLFGSEEGWDLAYLGRLHNQLDINDATTFELGASALFGSRTIEELHDDIVEDVEQSNSVFGVDARIKWKPLEAARHQMFVIEGEFLTGSVGEEDLSGGHALAQYQFAKGWIAEAGFDWLTEHEETASRIRAILAFVPTEFQLLRLQFASKSHPDEEDAENSVSLQYSFTIGSHPAHSY